MPFPNFNGGLVKPLLMSNYISDKTKDRDNSPISLMHFFSGFNGHLFGFQSSQVDRLLRCYPNCIDGRKKIMSYKSEMK